MINALSPAWIVRGLSTLVMIFAWGSLFFSSPQEANHLWAARGTIIGAVNAFVLVMTFRPVFLWAYKLTRADLWWFPLLEGNWTGELRSNWPRIQAMMVAAKGEGPRFDALTDEIPGGGEQIVKLEATIRCSLFNVEIEIRVPGTERTSRSIFVRPQWCRPAPPQIAYVYEQADHGHLAVTDAPRHRGAALLEFNSSTGELRGDYWTNRQGARGLNTAGTIIFRRSQTT